MMRTYQIQIVEESEIKENVSLQDIIDMIKAIPLDKVTYFSPGYMMTVLKAIQKEIKDSKESN